MERRGYLAEKNLEIPSLFDLCVMAFITMLPFVHKYVKFDIGAELYFVFGSIFLICIGMMFKPIRKFSSIPLGLLLLIGVANLFRHNYYVGEFSSQWINFCLLSEGFLYILFGVLLIKTIYEYARCFRLYYFALIAPIIYSYAITFDSYLGWSMTPLMAFGITGCLLCLERCKSYKHKLIALVAFLSLTIYKWDWLVYKFKMRPVMWKVTWKEMCEHSVLFGQGFDTSIRGWRGLVWSGNQDGWCFIHNDYLEFARSYGFLGLAVLLVALVPLFFGRRTVAWYLGAAFALMCFFQRTVFFPLKGAIIVVVIALMYLENGTARNLLS